MPRSALAAALATLGALALGGAAAGQQTIDGCRIFPASNIWNVPVAGLPLHPQSASLIANMNPGAGLHPDFGAGTWAGGRIGIPFDSVPASQPEVPIDFATLGWAGESDPGPYPIPADPQIEGEPGNAEGDRHVLVLRRDDCVLYESYYSWPDGALADSQSDGTDDPVECEAGAGGWCAASGAVFDLESNALRPAGWTSADAAGLPILPGLARWGEVATGEIRHALRFTVAPTRDQYVWPARHHAGSSGSALPPMGLRVRLRADFDLTGFSAPTRTILVALKLYGMILADNGSDWYLSGVPDEGWDDDALVGELAQVHGSDFEAVDVTSLRLAPGSAATPHLFSDGFERGNAAFALWSAAENGAP